MILCLLVIIIIDTVQVSTPSAQRDGPAEQDSTIECSNFLSRNLGCCMFMIFLAVLASVTINYFVVGKNANDVEKILTISKLAKCT